MPKLWEEVEELAWFSSITDVATSLRYLRNKSWVAANTATIQSKGIWSFGFYRNTPRDQDYTRNKEHLDDVVTKLRRSCDTLL